MAVPIGEQHFQTRHVQHTLFSLLLLSHGTTCYSLYPISDEENMPKALLPVANKPIISYTLDWLEKAGIHGNDFLPSTYRYQ